MATVLVCDDEAVLRELIRATLDGAHEIVEAADGDQALAQARATKPDVIVLDMMLPGRSGLDILTELRRDPGLAEVPVVMLTARTQASDREAFANAGASRFVAKPFSPVDLAQVVAELTQAR